MALLETHLGHVSMEPLPKTSSVRRLFHPPFHVYCAQTGSRRSGHRGRRDSLKPWQDGIHQAGTKGPRDELAGTGHGSPEAKAAQSSSSSAGLVSRKQRSRTIHTRVWISRQGRWRTQEGSCLHGRKGAVLLTLGRHPPRPRRPPTFDLLVKS